MFMDSSLGEASTREQAAARKGRETPMGDQVPPNQGGILMRLSRTGLYGVWC
jgi:hypothetical protein